MSVEVEHGEVCCHDHKKYQEDIYGVTENGELKEKNIEFLIKELTIAVKNLPQQKGKTVVDIGCGPCVYSAVALSAAFDEIYLAEFREDGRELVEKWRRKDPNAFNWNPVLEIIAKEEGNDVNLISDRARSKMKAVVFADIHQPGAAMSDAVPREFDAVASFGVVSVASNTYEQYKNGMKNLVGLVKPGGLLMYSDLLQPEPTPGTECHADQHGHGHGHSHNHKSDSTKEGHIFNPHGVPLNAEKVKPVLEALGVKIFSWKEFHCWGENMGEFLALGKVENE